VLVAVVCGLVGTVTACGGTDLEANRSSTGPVGRAGSGAVLRTVRRATISETKQRMASVIGVASPRWDPQPTARCTARSDVSIDCLVTGFIHAAPKGTPLPGPGGARVDYGWKVTIEPDTGRFVMDPAVKHKPGE